MNLQWHAMTAIWKRQLWSLLGNPLGYVFVLAFVLIFEACSSSPADFFVRNINDLGPINDVMPWLLAVLVPSIAMGTWASERELGTEEQLLTLPLSEIDALLGKMAGGCQLRHLCTALQSLEHRRDDVARQPRHRADHQPVFWVVAARSTLRCSRRNGQHLGFSSPVAFVIGTVVCGGLCSVESQVQWLDAFERGVISLGQIAVALSTATFFLGAATLSPERPPMAKQPSHCGHWHRGDPAQCPHHGFQSVRPTRPGRD